jgi:hypothetical protein
MFLIKVIVDKFVISKMFRFLNKFKTLLTLSTYCIFELKTLLKFLRLIFISIFLRLHNCDNWTRLRFKGVQ